MSEVGFIRLNPVRICGPAHLHRCRGIVLVCPPQALRFGKPRPPVPRQDMRRQSTAGVSPLFVCVFCGSLLTVLPRNDSAIRRSFVTGLYGSASLAIPGRAAAVIGRQKASARFLARSWDGPIINAPTI